MGELRMAKASLHVKRHLTSRELGTIQVALDALLATPAPALTAECYALYVGDGGIISDDEIKALIYELSQARKVKICRSKTSVDRALV